MIIKSKDYFNKKINWKKEYDITVVKSDKDINGMLKYFSDFIKLKSKNKYVGLDFEFNSSPDGKKIALFQINLESDKSEAKIFLFYPPDLNDINMDILVNLLTDINIKKILHGAESLDIPYLFKNIFINNKLRNQFCNNLFDTRYICEYYHLENKIDGKCKIYSILREMDVIDDTQLNMLLKNEEDMGPIYLIDIDVRNLDSNTMLYSAFDVLYLPALLTRFPDNYVYNNLIPEITCFNYIDRYDEIFTKPFSELVGKANNYFIKIKDNYKGKKLKLVDIYQSYQNIIDDDENIFSKLMDINYFKKFIKTYIKFIIYKNIFKNNTVWENNENISNMLIEFQNEQSRFQKIKLTKHFEIFFNKITSIIKNQISSNFHNR
jgi:hypothetical protein